MVVFPSGISPGICCVIVVVLIVVIVVGIVVVVHLQGPDKLELFLHAGEEHMGHNSFQNSLEDVLLLRKTSVLGEKRALSAIWEDCSKLFYPSDEF